MTVSSAVMYGSHSVPLIMSVWIPPSLSEASFIAVGKPAPPRPATPASRTRSSSAALVSPRQLSNPSQPIHSSLPSSEISMQVSVRPDACGTARASIAVTVPELGAWTGTLTGPCASAIICPPRTLSPTSTTGRAGAPICCVTGRTSLLGISQSLTHPGFDMSFRSGGWIPP